MKNDTQNLTTVDGASSDNQLKIDYQLCFSLYSTSRAITKQYAVLLKELEVTYPQYLVLLILWESDGLSIQDIAKKLELEGATTTPLIQRMEKLELVSRQRSSEDERRVHVHLTQKGKKLREKAKGVPSALGCALDIDEAAAQKIISQMNELKNNIKRQ